MRASVSPLLFNRKTKSDLGWTFVGSIDGGAARRTPTTGPTSPASTAISWRPARLSCCGGHPGGRGLRGWNRHRLWDQRPIPVPTSLASRDRLHWEEDLTTRRLSQSRHRDAIATCGEVQSAKSRGGWMSTTAAGDLISPKERENVRGEAYVHLSTSRMTRGSNLLGTLMRECGAMLGRAAKMAGS